MNINVERLAGCDHVVISVEDGDFNVASELTEAELEDMARTLVEEVTHEVNYWSVVERLVELEVLNTDQILDWVTSNLPKMVDPAAMAFKILEETAPLNPPDSDLVNKLHLSGLLSVDMVEDWLDEQRKLRS